MVKSKRRGAAALLLTLMAVFMLALVAPVAQAQTQTKDNPDDLVKGLASNRYFVAQSVKANTTFMAKNQDIEQQLKNTVDKYKKDNVYIAVISNSSFPSTISGSGQTALENYSNSVLKFLNNPTPEVLVMVNAQSQVLNLYAPKLSSSERDSIIKSATSAAATKNVTAGAVTASQDAADKINSNATTGLITTIVVILVVILVIVGLVIFMLNNAKQSWKQKIGRLEQLANEVSDQVVRVSDGINFLPDPVKQKADADFGLATRNFSEANTRLRELQGAQGVNLLLKGPDLDRQLNLTGSQFEQVRQALTQVEQQTKALPPL